MFAVQGTQVQSLVRELDPSCHNIPYATMKPKILQAITNTQQGQVNTLKKKKNSKKKCSPEIRNKEASNVSGLLYLLGPCSHSFPLWASPSPVRGWEEVRVGNSQPTGAWSVTQTAKVGMVGSAPESQLRVARSLDF